jgi:signal transduction histidine kinase
VSVAKNQIVVLLVDDDDEDYLLTRDMVAKFDGVRHELDRVADGQSALQACRTTRYDVCLIDYRLGAENGIQLVRDLIADGHDMPMIVLTGQGDHDVDIEAAEAGAADYLVKGEITATLLERTIRYAIRSHSDLRALRESETELRQAQRMEAVGQLAGGIAHDFNNLLGVIRGYSSIVLATATDEKVRRAIELIDQAAARAAELTSQLLAFSRRQVLQPEVSDLNEVVKETLTLLERLLGADILVDSQLDARLSPVLVDRGQMTQVILNLAVNAREAMPGGGTLTIHTENTELDEAYAAAHDGVEPGRYALVQITDSGPGMSEETCRHVFEPFFTTKEQGTGLGLSTVYGIVKQSGGHIWLYSELGIGTTFKVYFPATDAPVRPAEAPHEIGSLEGTETILLVEDADMLRPLVVEVLESYGYRVVVASDGVEAVELACAPQAPKIDLLLTDVVMPRMNGREVAEKLLEGQPSLRVLYTSGYPSDTVIRHGIAEARAAFIQKPYLARELATKIREVLADD